MMEMTVAHGPRKQMSLNDAAKLEYNVEKTEDILHNNTTRHITHQIFYHCDLKLIDLATKYCKRTY